MQKKTIIKSQCIRTAELTSRTAGNENSNLSKLYPEVDKALREAGLLKGKTKLPKLSTVLDAREKDIKLAEEKKKKRRKDRRTIYIYEKYASNGHRIPLRALANNLAKKYKLTFRFRMCHGRHSNLKERFIADCTQKVFTNVTYVPTDRKDEEFDPKRADKYYKCAYKSTKVDRKCIFDKKNAIQKQLFIMSSGFQQAICTYIRKSQGHLSKRINQHINELVAFWNLRDKYHKNIAKGSALITSKGRISGRFSFSTAVTPECSQELTQTPRGLSPLVDFMTARLASIQISDSNDETDEETNMSSSEDETLGEDFSQQLTPKTNIQKEFRRP